MPDHIHLMWEQLKMNGKEFSKNSFEKFTAKTFVNNMKAVNDAALKNYAVIAIDRPYNIWFRDPLAIRIFNKEMAAQKLDYIHFNPVSGKWKLAKDDISYYYSSARFYETGIDDFGFLNNLFTVFDGE